MDRLQGTQRLATDDDDGQKNDPDGHGSQPRNNFFPIAVSFFTVPGRQAETGATKILPFVGPVPLVVCDILPIGLDVMI